MKKRIVYLLLTLTIVLLNACTLTEPVNKVVKVKIANEAQTTFFQKVDLNSIILDVTYSSGDLKKEKVKESMLSNDDLAKLNKIGKHELKIVYQNFVCRVNIEVVTELSNVKVYYYDGDTLIKEEEKTSLSLIDFLSLEKKDHFELGGWYTEKELIYEWDFNNMKLGTNDVFLYAKWIVEKMNVKFMADDKLVKEIKVDYNTCITEFPKIPFKRGFVASWPLNGDVKIIEDMIVNAQYEKETYDIDPYILNMEFGDTVSSEEELSYLLDYIKFKRISEYQVVLDFEIDDFNNLMDSAINNTLIDSNVAYNFSLSGNNLIVNSSFPTLDLVSCDDENRYIQKENIETLEKSSRSHDFDFFEIDKETKTYVVNTSDQLYYVLERGYKPIFNNEECSAYKIYQKARNVLKEIINDEDDDIEKLHKIYHYLIENVTYDKKLFEEVNTVDSKKYKGFYLEGVFDDSRAVCDGISKAFTVLARIEGIKTIRATGASKNGGAGHAWNKVYLNGKWYVIDATSGGVIVSGKDEVLTHKYFLRSDDVLSDKYDEDNTILYKASEDYNYYKDITFTYNDKENDYYIESLEELKDICAFYISLNKKDATIDFYIGFDYGASLDDELQKALQKEAIMSYSSMIDDNIFTFNGYVK